MKINIDPMPAIRLSAADQINRMFNRVASDNLHRDQAHASKRSIAGLVVAGGAPTSEFAAEATARGVTPIDLANTILAKPNNAAARELARQKIMLKIDDTATPWEIDGILANIEM